jgi:outer membrane protein assembly factor BamA
VDEDLGGRRALADLAFSGQLNPLSVSARYDSAFPHDTRFTVGAEGGRRLEAIYRMSSETLGADLDQQAVIGEWREYLPVSCFSHTGVALRAKGGSGWGDVPLQSIFQLGGLSGEFPIRGYSSRVARGKQAAIGSAELRFPLWSPYRGVGDWPAFLGRLHAAGFMDAGRVWKGDDDTLRKAAGVELRADTLLGYYVPTTLVVGYAHGFDDDGGNRAYVTFDRVF